MKVCILGSGSRGNCIYVESSGKAILIDQGFSHTEFDRRLRLRGLDKGKIIAILISHEHHDHMKGAEVTARKMNVPVYGTFGTLRSKSFDVHPANILKDGVPVKVGPFDIAPFGVSHDASEPVQFTVRSGIKKLSIATDLGYISNEIESCIAGSDLLIIEANHDVDMLQRGRYPWPLKKRIMSKFGHLSNKNAADILFNLACNGGCGKAVLAHLSEENNTPEMAEKTIRELFESYDRTIPNFIIASQSNPSVIIEI